MVMGDAQLAAAPAPTAWVEYLCGRRQVEAVVRLEVDQALPEICGFVLHPTLLVRAELASAF